MLKLLEQGLLILSSEFAKFLFYSKRTTFPLKVESQFSIFKGIYILIINFCTVVYKKTVIGKRLEIKELQNTGFPIFFSFFFMDNTGLVEYTYVLFNFI